MLKRDAFVRAATGSTNRAARPTLWFSPGYEGVKHQQNLQVTCPTGNQAQQGQTAQWSENQTTHQRQKQKSFTVHDSAIPPVQLQIHIFFVRVRGSFILHRRQTQTRIKQIFRQTSTRFRGQLTVQFIFYWINLIWNEGEAGTCSLWPHVSAPLHTPLREHSPLFACQFLEETDQPADSLKREHGAPSDSLTGGIYINTYNYTLIYWKKILKILQHPAEYWWNNQKHIQSKNRWPVRGWSRIQGSFKQEEIKQGKLWTNILETGQETAAGSPTRESHV